MCWILCRKSFDLTQIQGIFLFFPNLSLNFKVLKAIISIYNKANIRNEHIQHNLSHFWKIICKVCWDKTLPAYPSCPSSLVRRVYPENPNKIERAEVEKKAEQKGWKEDRNKDERQSQTLCKKPYQNQNIALLGRTDSSPKHTIKKP